MSRKWLAGIFFLFLSFGCDDGKTRPADTGCVGGSADDQLARFDATYCGPMAQVVCTAAAGCGCGTIDGFPDQAACESSWRQRCMASAQHFRDDFDAGTMQYCEVAASKCIEAYRIANGACRSGMPEETLPAGCLLMLTVDTKPGETCPTPGVGCNDGRGICSPYNATCSAALPGEGAACEGVCIDGAVCNTNGTCVAGETGDDCESVRDCRLPLACIAGRCAETVVEDAACTEDDACVPGLACSAQDLCTAVEAPCTEPADCGENAICTATQARVCVPVAEDGQPCSGDEDCSAASWCDTDTCAPRPGANQPCASGVWCAPGLACNLVTALCAPLPQDGEPCALSEAGPFVCDDGLACLSDTCGPLPGHGETCGSGNNACAEGLGCSFNTDGTSTCEDKVGAGEPCTNDRQCLAGTYCEYSTMLCTTVAATGAPCEDGNECGPAGSCVPESPGGPFVCAPLPAAGEPCYLECTDTTVCHSVVTAGVCAAPVCGVIGF
ncbi:hypothetical protein KKD52_10740 [Myxococcota bacterium]|nr:hypothetical protein [Myxococcota bacterium]MBU1510828.1 hypothetical protein [Myxococcota bacterium]